MNEVRTLLGLQSAVDSNRSAARVTFRRMAIFALALCVSASNASADTPPAVPPPPGAGPVTKDTSANFWTLAPAAADGVRAVLVLPAQNPTAWIEPDLPGLPALAWDTIHPRDDRTIVVSSSQGIWRFDPKTPEKGAVAVNSSALDSESLASPWRLAARMPSSNHDLTAAVVDGRLYVAGGVTSDYGFPAKTKAFDELLELDPTQWKWRAAAKFSLPRIYCATVAFEGRVWVLGGDELHPDGQRRASTLAETFDPRSSKLTRAPDLPIALQAPLAFVAGKRLWIVGSRNRSELGQMASIGSGETSWRIEADALPHMWALAGAVLDDKLYACVPNTGLALFEPTARRWSVIPGPTRARSAQVAAWRGEVWIMGGCDIADWSETWIYNPTQRRWRRGPSLPMKLAWGAAAVIDDRLVVTGGAGREGPLDGGTFAFSNRPLVLTAAALAATQPFATDGESNAFRRWSDARLRGTGGAGFPFASTRIFPHFKFGRLATVLSIPPAKPDDPERLLVAEIHGPVWTFPNRPDVAKPDRMFDLPERFKASTHTYALAFHPRYPAVPYVYVLYNRVEPKPADNVLARFTVSSGEIPTVDVETERILLQWPSNGHNGGDVVFGPEGYLYVSVGDRGPPGDPQNMGQRVDVIAGGVLRLDVDRAEPGKNYSIPPDNPFVGMTDVRPEFWAYGLRNPWRMSFAPTGELWLGDNGDDSWESIHLIGKGNNYGWSVFEGSHPFKRTRSLAGPNPHLTPPAIELSHAEARSVIGGLVYRGSKHPTLVDHYLFGDFVTGSVWASKWDGAAPQAYRKIADTRGSTIAFGTDRSGEILLVRDDGQIHRLVEAPPTVAATAEFPRKLSETGLFGDTATHEPAAGVIPYSIASGLWSDGANVRRLLGVPGAEAIASDPEKENRWNLPDGSAVARTLELPTVWGPRKVETQLMYREHGTWQFYTYAWNEAQTDADLVSDNGETRPVPGIADRSWRYSSRSECTICHTEKTNGTIGLSAAQLNLDSDFGQLGRGIENQISLLASVGLLRIDPANASDPLPRKPSPTDPSLPLDARARSYLDVNCAHCHRAGGVGGRAAFQLMDSITLAETGAIGGQPLVPLLGADAKIVAPGHPETSELMHRFSSKEGGRMPPIGSDRPDEVGIALIRQWILQLPQ